MLSSLQILIYDSLSHHISSSHHTQNYSYFFFFFRFRKDLRKLSLDMKKSNIDRQWNFEWLDPEIVPNSISVWSLWVGQVVVLNPHITKCFRIFCRVSGVCYVGGRGYLNSIKHVPCIYLIIFVVAYSYLPKTPEFQEKAHFTNWLDTHTYKGQATHTDLTACPSLMKCLTKGNECVTSIPGGKLQGIKNQVFCWLPSIPAESGLH